MDILIKEPSEVILYRVWFVVGDLRPPSSAIYGPVFIKSIVQISKSSGTASLPEYQAVLRYGYVFLINLAIRSTSDGSESPPMKQKQVIAVAYLPIRECSISSVIGSPASSHSHGL